MIIVMHGTLVNELFQLSFIHSLNNELFLGIRNNPDTVTMRELLSHALCSPRVYFNITYIY